MPRVQVLVIAPLTRSQSVCELLFAGTAGDIAKPLSSHRLWLAIDLGLSEFPLVCPYTYEELRAGFGCIANGYPTTSMLPRELQVVEGLQGGRPEKEISICMAHDRHAALYKQSHVRSLEGALVARTKL